jgi:hypothetical protein
MKFASNILLCTVIAIAVIVLFGCNPQKKVQRAIHTVTYNDTAFNHVGLLWERFHPCANDTIFDIDTTSELVFIDANIDIDSLKKKICNDSVSAGKIIRIPCPPVQVITKTISVRDLRHEQIMRDSIDRFKSMLIESNALLRAERSTTQQLKTDAKDFPKQLWKRTLIMFIPIILLIIICALLIKRKSKII